jgi:hypothetical protein
MCAAKGASSFVYDSALRGDVPPHGLELVPRPTPDRAPRSRNFVSAQAYAEGSWLRLPDGLALPPLSLEEPGPNRDS